MFPALLIDDFGSHLWPEILLTHILSDGWQPFDILNMNFVRENCVRFTGISVKDSPKNQHWLSLVTNIFCLLLTFSALNRIIFTTRSSVHQLLNNLLFLVYSFIKKTRLFKIVPWEDLPDNISTKVPKIQGLHRKIKTHRNYGIYLWNSLFNQLQNQPYSRLFIKNKKKSILYKMESINLLHGSI